MTTDDFIGDYKIDLTIPADTDQKSLAQASKMADWIISLEEKNNFHLYGTGINKVGYWRIENDGGQDFDILLQSGETTHARIDNNAIFFTHPTGILDSMFKKIAFVRLKTK